MKKYIFPTNYKYASKFLGIIEYRMLLPICIYAGIIFFILYLIKIDFFWGAGIFIVLVGPPAILLSVGINGEPIIPFFISMLKFKRSKKVYLYMPTKK